jgi:hypothetical protein
MANYKIKTITDLSNFYEIRSTILTGNPPSDRVTGYKINGNDLFNIFV